MKNILRIVLVACVLVIAAVAIFLATFDADRYRPQLVAQLQTAVGKPVTLDRISLGWQQGIAVQFKGLAIYEGTQATGEPLIQVESAHGVLELLPLLNKRVQVVSVILNRPRIRVERDAQGHINLMGLMAAASPAAASGHTATVQGTPVSFEVASLRIEDGTLRWTDAATQPPTELSVNALELTVKNISPGKPLDIEAQGALAPLRAGLASERPNLRLSGRVTPPSEGSPGSCERLKLTVDDVPLEQVLPSRPGAPQLQGRLSSTLEGDAATLDPSKLIQALEGRGTLKLAQAKLANLNVLREVFQHFAMLPGLVETLKARLPPEYQAKLTANDTLLAPLDVSMQVERGAMQFADVRVSTDTFHLAGAGRVGFDGTVSIRATLRIEPVLSAAIIDSVTELQSLANRSGELEVPLTIQGQVPQVAVLPDMNYVASRVLVTKATDLLGELLRGRDAAQPEGQAPMDTPATDQMLEPSVGSLLGQVLQRALQKNEE